MSYVALCHVTISCVSKINVFRRTIWRKNKCYVKIDKQHIFGASSRYAKKKNCAKFVEVIKIRVYLGYEPFFIITKRNIRSILKLIMSIGDPRQIWLFRQKVQLFILIIEDVKMDLVSEYSVKFIFLYYYFSTGKWDTQPQIYKFWLYMQRCWKKIVEARLCERDLCLLWNEELEAWASREDTELGRMVSSFLAIY